MVVAGHVAPVAAVMPHHHRAVLAGQEVAVGLTRVPVLIELMESRADEGENKEELLIVSILDDHRMHFKDSMNLQQVDAHKLKFNLTSGFPSDQRKSPSMVLSFSPIH